MTTPAPKYPSTGMCDGALLEAFESTTRSTDLFCATAAKSGQTWLLTLLHHLRTQGRDSALQDGLANAAPWLELPKNLSTGEPYLRHERLALFAGLSNPRVFKMHVLWDEIPRAPGSGAKVITVTRDPRDLPYSMYRHFQALREDFDEDFDTYFETWMSFGYVFKFVRSIWPHRHDPDFLWLRYEDMTSDLTGQIARILNFTGWPCTDDAVARVLPLVDFTHMQGREDTKALTHGDLKRNKRGRFFREGGVGKNRARLSADQDARIVARGREEFEPECFDFVFSQGC
jgi:aryl sulfotransferase